MKLGFTVKASTTLGGSTADLAKKNKGSVASITKVDVADDAKEQNDDGNDVDDGRDDELFVDE